ncbi:hypothetical protein G6F66_015276 [Rhizopus arrhizus]|nr:hypothetical protein G6F66_015276 [Rhizopus arrhizus]
MERRPLPGPAGGADGSAEHPAGRDDPRRRQGGRRLRRIQPVSPGAIADRLRHRDFPHALERAGRHLQGTGPGRHGAGGRRGAGLA